MGAAELWTATKASYPAQGLLELTNAYSRGGTAIVDAVGQDAAQEVIDLWPIYAQADYDDDNAQHVAVAKRGVIAVLQERGGASSAVADVSFDSVTVSQERAVLMFPSHCSMYDRDDR